MIFHDISLHLTCSLVEPTWEKNMLDVSVPPVASPCPSSSAPRRRLAPTPAAAAEAVGAAAAGGAAAGPRWRRRKPLGAPGELGRLPPWPGLPINLNYCRS